MSASFWLSRRRLLALSSGLAWTLKALPEEPSVEIPPYNKLTDEQEIALGRDVANGLEKERNLQFVEDRSVCGYVDNVFRSIARTSRRPNLPYSIKIVDTREINALSLPGGFVYLNRGLMEWARSESELAATLSHEVGHVAGRHGANTISRESTADSLLSEASQVLFGDDLPAQLLKQVGGPVAFLAMMKYSREQELEADLFGFYNMQRAGWDPNGMVELFQHFGEKEAVFDPLFTIASSHPPSSERERQIVYEMQRFPSAPGLTLDSDRFRKAQAELRSLPAPVNRTSLSRSE